MTCAVCGCSEFNPCIDEETGEACGWQEPGLCTFCYFEQHYSGPEPDDDAPLVELVTDAEANRFLRERR